MLSEGKSHLRLSHVCMCARAHVLSACENVCGYAKALISANVLLCSFTFMNMYDMCVTELKRSSARKIGPASVPARSGSHLSVCV